MVLLLCPPSPFINSQVQPVKLGTVLLDELKEKSEQEDDAARKEKRMILSLIALSQPPFAGKLYDARLLLDDLLADLEPGANAAAKREALAFWSSVSHDPVVRRRFQEDRIAFKLYEKI